MESTALKMFTETVQEENNLIWIKPLCDFFNLHAKNQYSKIKSDPILGNLVGKNRPDSGENENLVGKKATDFGIIDQNGRILLSKKGFLRWVQIINPNTVDENLQDSFIQYQEKISDFLLGSMEEHEAIAKTNQRLQGLKQSYSEIGNEIKQAQKELNELLNNRYQYRLPFNQAKQLPN